MFVNNPASDFVRLKGIELSGKLLISVYNVSGVMVKEEEISTDILEISDLEEGIYQILLTQENRIYTGLFIKAE